jgi:hypothetical protein
MPQDGSIRRGDDRSLAGPFCEAYRLTSNDLFDCGRRSMWIGRPERLMNDPALASTLVQETSDDGEASCRASNLRQRWACVTISRTART